MKRAWVLPLRFFEAALVLLTPLTAQRVSAQSATLLPELVVLSERRTGPDDGVGWDRGEIQSSSPRTIDELLSREPSFSLYRRQTALFGNPTSAGVSLRNTGATAASRTLVLLDGIPQNDPFGGWVYWGRYDAAALESIRIVPSARSTSWGNQSPAGVIQMNRRNPFETHHVMRAGGGSQGTAGASAFHQVSSADGSRSVAVSAFGMHTAGFYAVDSSQRGAVDRKLETDLGGADLRFAWLTDSGMAIEPGISYYTEERVNGTELSGNSSEALDFSLRITSADEERLSWQAIAYHQRREFESVFSSVSDDRSSETMALDQFDVPGRGTGASFTMRGAVGENWNLSGGLDGRALSGETHEDAGTFRRREAGGEQVFGGAFIAADVEVDSLTRVSAAARVDAWQFSDGRRIETSLADGSTLREDYQDDRDGIEPSASFEISRDLGDGLAARFSGGSGFRLPTLNELHRPFRVRNDIVEANPGLEAERFLSVEGGVEWQPDERVTVEAAVFHHWVSEAIANVPVTDPAEIAAIAGVLPPGGTLSMRRNVDEARVAGVEGRIDWEPVDAVGFGLSGLWSDTRFSKSAYQPLLEGKPFPQAPELRVIADAGWMIGGDLSLFAAWEYGGSQFDDALATRQIGDYHTVRIGASWRVGAAVYQARIDNLFDEEIQTGLSGDGIRTYAAPRSAWLGVELEF
jgi:outer membrane cobalamin receptor